MSRGIRPIAKAGGEESQRMVSMLGWFNSKENIVATNATTIVSPAVSMWQVS